MILIFNYSKETILTCEYCRHLLLLVKTLDGANAREWRCGVVVITTVQLHSTKPELRFCAVSNLARGVSEI